MEIISIKKPTREQTNRKQEKVNLVEHPQRICDKLSSLFEQHNLRI